MKNLTKTPSKLNPAMLLVVVVILAACSHSPRTAPEDVPTDSGTKVTAIPDTTPRITGIGGIFFHSHNPKATSEWYRTHLGLTTDPYGAVFEFRNGRDPQQVNYLRWSPSDTSSGAFRPSSGGFMINYRVQNLEGLVRQLRSNGITPLDDIETYDYGKFVHLLDPFGNKIELWEPVDSVLTKLGGETNR